MLNIILSMKIEGSLKRSIVSGNDIEPSQFTALMNESKIKNIIFD